jgi:hypothetical protein
MGELMKKGFERECCKRIDSDLSATPGVTLSVAVKVFERDTLDIQTRKGLLLVPFGKGCRFVLLTCSRASEDVEI